MYNIIQANAKEPVPPVMTSVLSLNASVICIYPCEHIVFRSSFERNRWYNSITDAMAKCISDLIVYIHLNYQF